jgi:hypothetical protein
MAQVVAPPNVSAWIEDYLTYLIGVMDELPEIDAEWDSWDDIEQLDFVVEWDIKRDRLFQLEQWDRLDLLTADQRDRYRRLLDLSNERRPILDRLLAD